MTSLYYLKFLDNLSKKPEIKVNGDSRYHTTLSIIFSIISILCILVISGFFMDDWLSKNKINLIYNLDNRKYPNISLAGKHMGLIITDSFGQDIPENSRVFNIKFKYWQVNIPAFSAIGSDSVSSENKNINQQINNNTINSTVNSNKPTVVAIDIEPNDCNALELINPGFAATNKFFTSTVCLDFGANNIQLAGKYGSIQGFSFFNINLNRCVNSTENANSCMPQPYIDKVLAQAVISMFTTEYDVNPEDLDSPLQEYYNLESLRISASIFKRFDKKYNKIILNYDKGLLQPDIKNLEAYRTDNILESVDLRGSINNIPGLFNQITLQGSGKNEVFNISFMKIPQVLANVGGILQVILYTGQILMFFWSENSMLEFVISQVFTEEEREKSIKFFKENKNRKFSSNYLSFKTIFNQNNNPNFSVNNDNIEQKDKNKDLNHNLNADVDKDLSSNHLVKNNNYIDFTPKELKNQKRFDDENKDNGKKFIGNNNTSKLNIKNQLNEINEIKAESSHNNSNNKEITNARQILRDCNDKQIKKIDDPFLNDNSNQKEERYLIRFVIFTLKKSYCFLKALLI